MDFAIKFANVKARTSKEKTISQSSSPAQPLTNFSSR
jgi:hypothetical protein